MPELPEVETIARAIKPELVGRSIVSADLNWTRTLATPSVRQFREQVVGQKVGDVTRRAKYLNIVLTDYHLLIHLRMSGDIIIRKREEQPEKHDRLILHFSNKKYLAFNDTRKFGRIWLVKDPSTIFSKLGPEPLEQDFTPQWLYENLRKRKRQLKPLLLDQAFLSGLGNIYTDEALHIAKLHPLAVSNVVSVKQAEALYEAICSVLKEGIRRNGASIDWVYRGGSYQNYFRVYDCEGKPCQVCGTEIQKLFVGQRGTHICPTCQRLR
ncbi:MAG: bifunctional DNA-formamidopyrimidine glycosylase/DNA-(apurinic or apyrimidinic site) lyase [Anaerolineales bacterium]|nr:bifunctional DNA-formamidopyrimidine glycosylase/DNA-(apurinic or apyrimidinic site) lyase [Anaerolineales bacterium]